jgi:hypothetical protein
MLGSGGQIHNVSAIPANLPESLDTYAYMWPDSDDSTRAAVDKVLAAPITDIPQHPGDFLGTTQGGEARNA